jgi:hypothetical protein
MKFVVSPFYSPRNKAYVPVIIQGGSNMTGTDLCVNKSQFVPVIFEPPCICCILSALFQMYVDVISVASASKPGFYVCSL